MAKPLGEVSYLLSAINAVGSAVLNDVDSITGAGAASSGSSSTVSMQVNKRQVRPPKL
ncbi:hypothetical protein PC129_g23835 [Phytophthora cactorum]|uniref:Uncharacterized protein n=1 Tax=Phytophthora cactorum TaxID=29920 RepID=A0A8T1JEH1_9STRA|nr:hypothetical protein Pcac1_g7 [Phytophthora cactorum]KAG2871775.1 hypothetical protein PC114_g26735 [Phytophthora cactorum]KAG2960302.1 hypothetical protein PC119_g26429 [Phytophthora cactorum]KAG2972042.1 hypothetical protein PC120_g26366 [Phytophthora cactorum]KAG3123021.1 hypothetical protein C6341_g26734 [Phytophthora cactorum]